MNNRTIRSTWWGRNTPRVIMGALAVFVVFTLFVNTRTASTTVLVSGLGALDKPTGSGTHTGEALNNTHWKVQAGDTITDTILGATDAVTGTNGCGASQVAVQIQSSVFGNTIVCGSFDGSTITFTWTVPETGACDTTVVAYATAGQNGFDLTNNSLIPGGNGSGPGGLAIVDSAGNVIGSVDGVCPTPQPSPKGALDACKFYDFNANGFNDAEPPLNGWPMTINPLDGAIPNVATQLTAAGCVTWGNLTPGSYSVTEGTPVQTNWFASTAKTLTSNVTENSHPTVQFGNYCTVPSGGLTLGFWSNTNGQAILAAHDPAWRTLLNSACLRKANGDPYTVSTVASFATAYADFRTWILGAKATNMAYMLSAQLAAMKLNIAYGSVDGNAFDQCSGETINQLVADASNAAGTGLCTDGYTPSGDPNRAAQEARKNCLDKLNNGGPVIPVTPCAYTFAP
jgi:hypothetical protein